MLPLKQTFRDSQIATITNFFVVSLDGIKGIVCIKPLYVRLHELHLRYNAPFLWRTRWHYEYKKILIRAISIVMIENNAQTATRMSVVHALRLAHVCTLSYFLNPREDTILSFMRLIIIQGFHLETVFKMQEVCFSEPFIWIMQKYVNAENNLIGLAHYENTPIQIYWKNSPPKTESFQIKILIFFICLLKT